MKWGLRRDVSIGKVEKLNQEVAAQPERKQHERFYLSMRVMHVDKNTHVVKLCDPCAIALSLPSVAFDMVSCYIRYGNALMIAVCISPKSADTWTRDARSENGSRIGLSVSAASRAHRGGRGLCCLGMESEKRVSNGRSGSQVSNSSLSWDLCGSMRVMARESLYNAAMEGFGAIATWSPNDIQAYIETCECVLACNSYISSGTYLIEVRRLVLAFRANASKIMNWLSPYHVTRTTSAKLMKDAPRGKAFEKDVSDRNKFEQALLSTNTILLGSSNKELSSLRCPKCGNTDNVAFRARQDRSGDEAMTYYLVCHACHTVSRM